MNADLRYADGRRENPRKSARKKKKISRRWTQIEYTQMGADKFRVNLREKEKISRRWAQIKSV